ncbi:MULTISPECIES: YtpI family protein [Paenibacillus]|uniref:YtpI family protein n=1 Tax=Paenibacillus radicis (ex Xue et al. 2023) TaxID=2972489 RepID=A0ABT1YNA3_9BACL|nr:YtpI family protein [Paenibacillus radicis (ex Xue et al. 2023)]MCR8634657.1 YtpI family protein [Paenibacillus radicis (ex Xue et al. 2023)]
MEILQALLPIFIFVPLILSVYYSFRSRRNQDPKLRGIYAARMNIAMGAMLVVIAVSQLFFFTDSNLRRVFGTICFLLGLFNLFAGLRNHSAYSKL